LFFEYVRLVKDLKPKYFLLENVKMKQESKDIITEYMGVEPIEINSALVSAQTRKRLYWTNIPNVGQPEDKGIVLKDIIEDGMAGEAPVKHTDRNRRHLKDVNGKSLCASATMYKGAGNNGMTLIQVDDKLRHPEATKKGYAEAGEGEGLDLTFPQSRTRRGRSMKDKSNCLTAAGHEMGVVIDPSKPNQINPDKSAKSSSDAEKGTQPHMQDRVFHEDGKSHSLTASFANRTKVGSQNKLSWRKLTPLECERLQTVPDGYTLVLDENGKQLVSDSQRYKMLGNGWTVDVITHIMKNMEYGS
jgi:DNA (cytosine-5)-methyltransferase 3A